MMLRYVAIHTQKSTEHQLESFWTDAAAFLALFLRGAQIILCLLQKCLYDLASRKRQGKDAKNER